MSVSRIEALADAITKFSGYHDPESPAYQNRNPGNLNAISDKHPRDAKGKRIFKSALDGYQALLFDLVIKCAGKSRTRLKPDSNLKDLAIVYSQPPTAAGYYAKFLRRSLNNDSITEKTPLEYFITG